MPRARLETELTGNNAPFIRSIEEAEKRAATFGERLTGLFKRDPTARAEKALSQFGATLASGDVSGAIASISERMHGFGLLAGVALGGAAAAYINLRNEALATDKAQETLVNQFSKPISAASGPAALTAQIQTLGKSLDDLIEKRGTGFADFVMDITAEFYTLNNLTRSGQRIYAMEEGGKAQMKAMEDRVTAETESLRIKKEGLSVSSAQAALDKNIAEAAKKREEVDAERNELLKQSRKRRGGLDQGDILAIVNQADARKKAINDELALDNLAVQQKAAAKIRELDIEKRVTDLAAKGAPVEVQNRVKMEEQLAAIKERQLDTAQLITAEERTQLAVDQAKLKVALDQLENALPKKILEKAKYSFQELSETPIDKGRFDPLLMEKFMAQQAAQEEALGQQARGRGDIAGAQYHFTKEEGIKAGIGAMKDADKDPALGFANALNTTAVPHLVSIEAILGKLSFANQ